MSTISYPTYVRTCAVTDYHLDPAVSQRQDRPQNITEHIDCLPNGQHHVYCIEWRREPVGLGLQLQYKTTLCLDVLFNEYSGFTQHSSGASVLNYLAKNNAYLDTPQDVKQLRSIADKVCYAQIQRDYVLSVIVLLE